MRLFDNVAIIGVGLIGGSIGLCIKKKKLAKHVVGISRHERTIRLAKKSGAIDYGCLKLRAISDADLIILATPVDSIINIGTQISSWVKPGALITDTGSSKKTIVKKLENTLPNFVGAHPLSGLEKQGVMNASADLFRGSLCVLTPTAKTSKAALNKIKNFWIELGAKVIFLSPARHDKLIAYVSHLPHVVAFSLMQSIPHNSLFLASSGLKDATRIAASAASLWKDILFTNSENVLDALKSFTGSLSQIKSAIIKKDEKALEKLLNQARLKRESPLLK